MPKKVLDDEAGIVEGKARDAGQVAYKRRSATDVSALRFVEMSSTSAGHTGTTYADEKNMRTSSRSREGCKRK